VFFVAFGGLEDAIAKNVRTGDKLLLEAQIRASNRVDAEIGETNCLYIVQSLRFVTPGKAKRAELARTSSRLGPFSAAPVVGAAAPSLTEGAPAASRCKAAGGHGPQAGRDGSNEQAGGAFGGGLWNRGRVVEHKACTVSLT
jgi:hypothetical protein